MDTIDVSAVDGDLMSLGHSYYGDNKTIITDLYLVLRGVKAAERLHLRAVSRDGLQSWVFPP
jgi:hypothetical protein